MTIADKTRAPQVLKDTMVRKDFQTWKDPGERHKLRWGPPGTVVRMCLERARLFTQSYKQTEGQPEVIRRAEALAHILENMTIYIRDGERIVGNFASDPASLPIMPELAVEWLEEGIREQWDDLLDEEGHRELGEIMDYWRDKCIDAKVKALLPDYLSKWVTYGGSGGIISADQYQADRAALPLHDSVGGKGGGKRYHAYFGGRVRQYQIDSPLDADSEIVPGGQ